MGEAFLQRLIAEELRPLIERWLASRKVRAFTGADQFLYWVPGDPTQRIAPDVYVIPGMDPASVPASLQLWVERAPSFALEIVSKDVEKDYVDNPPIYSALGAKELVIFDPGATSRSRTRVRWQVYRRIARRGFVRIGQSMSDRVQVTSLGCWLRAVGGGRSVRLRVATGPEGDELFQTAVENAEASAQQSAALAKEETLRRAIAETQAREETERRKFLEAEVARLQAELARNKG